MPSIKNASRNGVVLRSLREEEPAPVQAQKLAEPQTPPLDLPMAVPQRGIFPANLVLASDRSNSSRAFRGPGSRSAAFPYPPTTTAAPPSAPASSFQQIQSWAPNTPFKSGAYVRYAGNLYVALQFSNSNIPPPIAGQASSIWQLIGAGNTDSLTQGISQNLINSPATDGLGNIDLAGSGVKPTGSISPIVSTPFSYSNTNNSVTISWNNFSISLVDGSTIEVSNGSQEITGLRSSTTYSFFPYYDPNTASIKFVQASDIVSPENIYAPLFPAYPATGYVSTKNSFTNPTTGNFSVELWFYATSAADGTLIEANATETGAPSSTYGISLEALYDGSTGVYFYFSPGLPNPTFAIGTPTVTTWPIDTWHHVVMTYSGISKTMTAYVDGISVSTHIFSSSPTGNTVYWRVNNGYNGGQNENVVSRFAYYSGLVLSATQIAAHYNALLDAGTGPYDATVKLDGASNFWILDETSGTTATDSIGTDTGTYQGSVTLGTSYELAVAEGSPAEAWFHPSSAVVLSQFTQKNYPLSAGASGFTVSTTSSGSGGGIQGGWSIPGLPYGLVI